jgi:hypothetical protein
LTPATPHGILFLAPINTKTFPCERSALDADALEATFAPNTGVVMNDWAGAIAVGAMALAAAVYFTATAWFKHRERLAMIEHGLNPDTLIPLPALSSRVKELASDPATKIEAIKVHREETGASLAQAKKAVDSFTTGKQG